MLVKFHLFKNKLPLMNRALDAYALREKVMAKNVANVSTPDYKPEMVKFEELFNEQQRMVPMGENAEIRHMPIGVINDKDIKAEIENQLIPEPEMYFSGESHVNIDREMAELAKNQIRFKFGSLMVKKFFSGLNTAITGFRE